MAEKKKKEETPALSWDDFNSDNLLSSASEEEENDEQEESEEEEEQEEEEKKPKAKKKAKEDEEESESEEDDEEKPKKTKVKAKAKEEEQEKSEEESEESEESNEEESEEESEDEEEDSSKFFEEVEKLTGQEVEVDYGDIDPLSPQGVALREKAVGETAVDNFLEHMEQNFPQVFKAFKHAYNGGDVADLYKVTSSRDYSKVVLKDDDKALAKEILKEYYQGKGVKNQSRIDKILAEAEDSEEGLVTEAKAVLTELQEEQASKEQEVLKSQETKAKEQKRRDGVIVSALDEVLDSGKLDSFKLGGKAEANEFRSYVIKSIRRTDNGGYEFATQIDPNNLEKLLQYQFFQFKKGDLSKLIQIKATTENTKKLRLRMGEEKAKMKKTAADDKDTSKKLSLTDFNSD